MMATRIIIEGEVQGVGYRIWMLNEAIKQEDFEKSEKIELQMQQLIKELK